MRLEGLDTDAYLVRIRRDTSGVTISDMTLHGPQLHGAIFGFAIPMSISTTCASRTRSGAASGRS